MAITIEQSPTSPNMANANLIYQVSSNQTTQAQFQYVLDVQNANRTVLQRIKQQPNPAGVGVFDVGQIITNYVGIDEVWKTTRFATSSFANEQFWVAFGEEYGTSTSSSITLYNGSGTAGAPAKSGSWPIDIANGLVEPNSGDWNFPSSSYVTMSLAPGFLETYSYNYGLSYAPTTQKIMDGDYATIAIYNGNFDNDDNFAQDLYHRRIRAYDATGSLLQTLNLYNLKSNGGGPRTSTAQEWQDTGVYNGQNAGTHIIYAGVGPQNLADNGTSLNSNWSYYEVALINQEGSGTTSGRGVYATYRFDKQERLCVSNGVRFTWKNEFGVWDYYTARLAINSGVQIERNAYQQSFVNFSNGASTLPYNISRRGTEQFQNKLNQSFNVTTDPLDQATAEWLRELFFSTQVYVQEGIDFVPVVISNPEVIEKTNPRSQKIFQYAFDYQYANQLRARV
jgi:hypothetical protein